MQIITPHAQLALAAPDNSTDVNSWKVSAKHGTQAGIGVSVSGAGAWAKLTGTMTFKIRTLSSSKTYDEMRTQYNISGGISAFWNWLGISANASTHKEQIHQVFKEVSTSQEVDGSADISLEVSGLYPNVQVDASAYVLVLQIEDSQGNTFTMASSADPGSDTGAQDQNGNSLPERNNKSTITL